VAGRPVLVGGFERDRRLEGQAGRVEFTRRGLGVAKGERARRRRL
jgi:hypothetical protein